MLIISSEKNGNDYSSVQFNLPENISKQIQRWGDDNIDESDVYTEAGFGREDNTHVTVKYGFHTNNVEEIEKIVNGYGSFEIILGKISKFTSAEDFDVVKIEVKGQKLHELHELLNELPNSDSHPDYQPHCTVSYVKKGKCNNLSGNTKFRGERMIVRELVFSSKSGNKTKIKL